MELSINSTQFTTTAAEAGGLVYSMWYYRVMGFLINKVAPSSRIAGAFLNLNIP
jgi:hypothetical protein